ncbi:MAG TPA: calcium-binding protein, partial [Stellaceae bacterium]|nr:calcium-binding protein [Stellaceae bacterium]
ICIAGPNPATIVNDGVISGGIGVYRYPFSGSILTLTNAGTISSTAGTAGTAVILSNADFKGLLVVDVGAVFVGAVEGGGNSEVDFLAAGVADAGNMTGFATIGLGNGVSHSLTLTDANFTGVNFNHITVVGGDSGNTVNAIGVTDPTHTMIFVGGAGNDAFTGGAGNDTFRFSAAALQATDSVDGAGGARDTLQMTSFGTINAAGVSGVEIYRLANGGSNTLVLANANASGITGGLIRIYGGNAGNTVNGAAVNLLPAVQLVMYGGAGTDHFTGGAGADTFVFTASNLGAADTVAGSGGSDELLLTTAGAIHAGGVRGVENIALAGGGANTLTLTNANFTGVIGASIRVIGGNGKNTIDASAVTGANALVFVGGPGSDVVKAGTVATITGRGGTNDFEFVAPGTHTITDFGLSATNRIDFSSAGFALGLAGTATPTALPASLIGSLTDGSFSNNIQRFSYNKGAGQVLFDADGSDNGSSAQVVATLTNDPTLTASHLFFVT